MMRHKAVVDLGGGGIRYEGGMLQAHSSGEAMPHMPLHLWCFGIKNLITNCNGYYLF